MGRDQTVQPLLSIRVIDHQDIREPAQTGGHRLHMPDRPAGQHFRQVLPLPVQFGQRMRRLMQGIRLIRSLPRIIGRHGCDKTEHLFRAVIQQPSGCIEQRPQTESIIIRRRTADLQFVQNGLQAVRDQPALHRVERRPDNGPVRAFQRHDVRDSANSGKRRQIRQPGIV